VRVTGKIIPFIVILCAFLFVTPVSAQESGIKVIPATIEKPAKPGDVLNEVLEITNVSEEEKEYYIYKRNIKGVEEGGVPVFSLEGEEPTGYEISEWIEMQAEPIRLAPRTSLVFPITIRVPETASPGSHFGGIFVSVEPPRLREIGAGVGYEVASIISIRIDGDIIDDARIRSFSTDKLFYSSKNVRFTARLENQGNILIRPYGPITITSALGGEPRVLNVNDTLAGVFPGTVREIDFSWDEEGLGFGKYEAILALTYEGEGGNKTIDASLVFWIFPINVIIPVLVGFIGIILGGYLLTRYYINQAVMRAAGGRRISSYRYRRQVGVSRFTFVFVTVMGVLVIGLILMLILFA
jgi:hypothetical protein